MEAYSGETRIELTQLGWRYIAKRLKEKSKAKSQTSQAEQKKKNQQMTESSLRRSDASQT
jgi:hypothetical protein